MTVKPRGTSWQVAFTHRGNRYRKQFTTEVEARQWEADANAALLRGDLPSDTAGSVAAQAMSLQMALQRTYQRYWSGAKSEDKLMINAKMIVEYLGPERSVTSIGAADIDNMIDHYKAERNANATINRKLSALSKILSTGERYIEGYRKPRIEKLKEPEGRMKVYTPEEIAQMVRAARHLGKPWLADMIIIGVDTGLRRGEILGLRRDNVLEEGGKLWITLSETKNGKSRRVPCTERVEQIILTVIGTFPSRSTFDHAWVQLRHYLDKDDDKDFVFHTCRHTFCSNLVRRGVDVLTVARLAGHSSVQVTMRYAKLAPDNLAEAIGVLEA